MSTVQTDHQKAFGPVFDKKSTQFQQVREMLEKIAGLQQI